MKKIFDTYQTVLRNASRIIIHGAGGNTRTIVGILQNQGFGDKLLCIDKVMYDGETIFGTPVLFKIEFAQNDIHLISFGETDNRIAVFNDIKNSGYKIGNCIARDAIFYNPDILECENNQIFNLAYIGPGAIIGNNNIINTHAIVEHEVVLKDNIHVAPGTVICGRVTIGNNVYIGANSVIRDKISVCDNVLIGAGSVVIGNISEPGTYVGNPARKIQPIK